MRPYVNWKCQKGRHLIDKSYDLRAWQVVLRAPPHVIDAGPDWTNFINDPSFLGQIRLPRNELPNIRLEDFIKQKTSCPTYTTTFELGSRCEESFLGGLLLAPSFCFWQDQQPRDCQKPSSNLSGRVMAKFWDGEQRNMTQEPDCTTLRKKFRRSFTALDNVNALRTSFMKKILSKRHWNTSQSVDKMSSQRATSPQMLHAALCKCMRVWVFHDGHHQSGAVLGESQARFPSAWWWSCYITLVYLKSGTGVYVYTSLRAFDTLVEQRALRDVLFFGCNPRIENLFTTLWM